MEQAVSIKVQIELLREKINLLIANRSGEDYGEILKYSRELDKLINSWMNHKQ